MSAHHVRREHLLAYVLVHGHTQPQLAHCNSPALACAVEVWTVAPWTRLIRAMPSQSLQALRRASRLSAAPSRQATKQRWVCATRSSRTWSSTPWRPSRASLMARRAVSEAMAMPLSELRIVLPMVHRRLTRPRSKSRLRRRPGPCWASGLIFHVVLRSRAFFGSAHGGMRHR